MPELISNLMDVESQGNNNLPVFQAFENAVALANRITEIPDVDLSRDIGLLVLGLDATRHVRVVPPGAESFLGFKFNGDKQGIGWIEREDESRNVAHLISLDDLRFVPVHPMLKEGLARKTLKNLVIVHQFLFSQSACESLKELYALTPAEINFCKKMSEGMNVKEAANALNVGRETAKTHLKNIFSKTGVRRQTELIRILTQISAAATIHDFSRTNKINIQPDWKNGLISTQTSFCRTRYGTRLAYSTYGDPNGVPFIYFHSSLGCRMHTREMAVSAKRLGRLIYTFDRPGFGHSDPIPRYSPKVLANCTLDFMDSVGVKSAEALTLGFSGRLLLEALPILAGRIEKLYLYSFRGTITQTSNHFWRKAFIFFMKDKSTLRNLLNILRLNISQETVLKNFRSVYRDSPSDMEIISKPGMIEFFCEFLKLCSRQSVDTILYEHLKVRETFEIDSENYPNIPVHAFFGSEDTVARYEYSKPVLSQLPNWKAYELKAQGQLMFFDDFGRFLEMAFSPEKFDKVTCLE